MSWRAGFSIMKKQVKSKYFEGGGKVNSMTTWRKVGCFLVTAVAAFSALAAIDADSYVQRGLVAQWDGIDNLATGTHVADTNVWVDRTPSRTPTRAIVVDEDLRY